MQRNKLIIALIALLAVTSAIFAHSFYLNTKYTREIETLQSENLAIRSENQALLENISHLKNETKELRDQIAKLGNQVNELKDANERLEFKLKKTEETALDLLREVQTLKEVKSTSIELPAVNPWGEGIMIPTNVFVTHGLSGTYFEISEVLSGVGAEKAGMKAVKVVCEILKTSPSKHQFLFKIREPKTTEGMVLPIVVDGESGGAGLTVALISAIGGYTLRSNITITGTIELDHSIGPVGGVNQKAIAARNEGYRVLLVPSDVRLVVPGIEIVPISKIEDALKIMLVGYS